MSNYTNNLFNPEEKNNSWVQLYSFVPEKSRVLDVGCSSGNFGDVLIREKRCEVIGVDIDEPDIEKAKTKLTAAHVLNIERDDIGDLGKFDVVVFADVLEHLLNPVAALKKVKKALKPGGRVVFSIPNMAHASVRLMLLRGFFEYTPIGVLDRTHLHYYDEVEVQHIFSEAKFEVKEVAPTTWTYPISKVSEELKGMGLAMLDENFYKLLERTKAHVWQFVGYAVPSAAKEETLNRSFTYRMPPEELLATLESRDRELKMLGKRVNELEEENKSLKDFYDNPLRGVAKRAVGKTKHLTPKQKHDIE